MPWAEGACEKCKQITEVYIPRATLNHLFATAKEVSAKRARVIIDNMVGSGTIVCSKCNGPLERSGSLLFQRLTFEREAVQVASSVRSASIAIKCRTSIDARTDDVIAGNMERRTIELVQRAKSLYRHLGWDWDD